MVSDVADATEPSDVKGLVVVVVVSIGDPSPALFARSLDGMGADSGSTSEATTAELWVGSIPCP
jgi:hypothetical protein